MLNQVYNKTNFHKYTFCIFKEVDFHEITHLKLNFKSKSGSSYYFTENGVYRLSNHWSRVANCRWRLIANDDIIKTQKNRTKLGFAYWKDFYPDNNLDKLYYIEVNFELKQVNYFHKDSTILSDNKIKRTATECIVIIKQIRNLFNNVAFGKNYNCEKQVDKQKIIELLITTNKTLVEIKSQLLQ